MGVLRLCLRACGYRYLITWLFSHCVQSLESEGGSYEMVSYQSEMEVARCM